MEPKPGGSRWQPVTIAGGSMADDEQHLTRTEARAGSTNHVTRYVLPISLVLVVLLFLLILFVWR
jgi:hypothetical protein